MSFTADEGPEVAASFDLKQLPAAFFADPFPFYRALREHQPVKRMADGSIVLTRYADCEFVYKNPKLFSSDKQQEFRPKYGDSPLRDHHTTSLVFNDPPLHTRVRRLIIGALSPKAIGLMLPGLEALVERLLDDLEQRAQPDLIDHFAAAIPIEIIGNLLGVPVAERGPLREWSLAILGALEPVLSPAAHERGNRAVREFLAYLEGLVALRRASPGDPQRDVLTRLIQGERNDGGGDGGTDGGSGGGSSGGTSERLSEPELLHNCIFLLNAGHETTTNLIGNGLVALSRFTQQRERLLAQPTLIKSAVEEVLRYESSNQLGNRITTEAVEVGGVALPARTPITLCIGAANRDPAQFPDPETFDIARTPNRHLAFGSGIHQCAGMGLARLEGEVAISRFLARFPGYRLVGDPVRGGRARFRGFLSVPCEVRPRGPRRAPG